jgi:hypothetical protein
LTFKQASAIIINVRKILIKTKGENKMKIIYEAFDGKIFETESACVDYEKEKWANKLPKNTVCFYTMDYQPLPVTVDSTYDVFFVRVNEVNDKVIEFFDYLEGAGGANLPDLECGAGLYQYNTEDDYWENVEECIAFRKAQVEELEELLKIM